jgi:hypothetical protein
MKVYYVEYRTDKEVCSAKVYQFFSSKAEALKHSRADDVHAPEILCVDLPTKKQDRIEFLNNLVYASEGFFGGLSFWHRGTEL